ncbi:MAG TPA: hypothetical protein VFV71_08450 [Burkholderiales bacterium]|nr:hypothetical protein [Burkholderiales bacterium]
MLGLLEQRAAGLLRALLRHRASGVPGEDGSERGDFRLTPSSPPERRALALLESVLSPAQRASFGAHSYFWVETPQARRFCVLPFSSFNVLDAGSGESYCAGPAATLPVADLMLAQKLLLETDPQRFFAVANRRRELDPARLPEAQRPEAVMQARLRTTMPRPRWTEVPALP